MSPRNQESDTLRSALRALGPTDFDDLPLNTDDELHSFTCDLLTKSYDAVQSVPPPHGTTDCEANAISSDIASLRKEWGQPINKVDDVGNNPLRIPVYKLAAPDGKGAWFARRSIHEGLPFDRWKAKLQDEFEETMRRRKRNGGCLEGGSVRGIGCERCLDRVKVPMRSEATEDTATDDTSPEAKGNEGEFGSIEAYHLSAIFQGPSTPRDFVTLLITSDRAAEARHAEKKDDQKGDSDSQYPRSYMVISRPCNHLGAPPRKGFIRGNYESIEFIREIPKTALEEEDESKEFSDTESTSSARGTGILPVEWTMITRSDPGGSIPRFLVERGTPPSVIDDARKFMEWAYEDDQDHGQPEIPLSAGAESPKSVTDAKAEASARDAGEDTGAVSIDENLGTHITGLIDGVLGLVLLVLELVTPRVLHDYILHHKYTTTNAASDRTADGGTNEVGSVASDPGPSQQNASREASTHTGRESPARSESNESHSNAARRLRFRTLSMPVFPPASEPPSKELEKLARRKKHVEDELHALHEEHRNLISEKEDRNDIANHNNNNGSQAASAQSSTDQVDGRGEASSPASAKNNKAAANRLKRLSAIEKKETKFESRISKINEQEQKARARADARQNKDAQRQRAKSEAWKSEEEIRALRDEVHHLSREKEQLMEVIGRLQKENTKLVADR